MMKKVKVILTIILIIGMTFISFGKVEAHSIELDPKSLINFPMMISNGKGKITIKSSETNYSLYYQAVEIPDAIYEQIEQTTNKGKTKLDSIKAEMEALEEEYYNLKTIFDKANEEYKEKIDNGVTGTELETSKVACETAQTNCQNKATEYNNKLKEYEAKTDEVNTKINELTPTYVESKWTKTEDGSFTIDLSQFSGNKTFAIWVKLISSDGTISYDEGTYTTSGTKTEEIKEGNSNQEENNTKKDTEIKTTAKGTEQKDDTVSSKKLPKTGVSMAIIISIVGMLLLAVVTYKKYDNYRNIK